jgi:hypothetical protein
MFIILNTGNSPIRSDETINKNFEALFKKYGRENIHIFKNSLYNKEIDKALYQEIQAINIPAAVNKAIAFAKEKGVRFLHLFHDDLKMSETFDAARYEKFISDFSLGYYNNPKLNPANNVYDKAVPRFVIETKDHYDSNVSVYTFDSPEYMLFDLSVNTFLFDENLANYYNIEYLWRLKCNKVIPLMNFYFDFDKNNTDMARDNGTFLRKVLVPSDLQTQQIYLQMHQIQWVPDNNIDEVVNFFIQKRCKDII